LSPNIEKQVAQYRDLLGLGFGRTIDAVEMHTYIDAPEDGWAAATRRIEDMTAEATGRALPVWSTEHGYTADYAHELSQARLLMRSYLEAKRIGYPVVIWHMFGNPQGAKRREIEFAIFRGARDGRAPPQPRPAGVAYGVMTRQLAGARFSMSLAGFDKSVKAYVFDRGGEIVAALWTVDGTSKEVTLPVAPRSSPTITGLFGRRDTPPVRDGRIRLEADGDPVFVTALDAAQLPR
jgi:hypothetical protein